MAQWAERTVGKVEVSDQIRMEARQRGLPLWKVAQAANISVNTMCRWMRSPTPDQAQRLREGIKKAWEEKRMEVLSFE